MKKKKLNLTVSQETWNRLEAIHKATFLPKSRLLEIAINNLHDGRGVVLEWCDSHLETTSKEPLRKLDGTYSQRTLNQNDDYDETRDTPI